MRTFVIRSGDIDRCPRRSLSAEHYRTDGTCRCDGDPTLCAHCGIPTILRPGRPTIRVHTLTGLARCYPDTVAEAP